MYIEVYGKCALIRNCGQPLVLVHNIILTKFNVLTIHHASAVSIPMSGVVNGPLPEIPGLLHTEAIAVAAIQHTISIG